MLSITPRSKLFLPFRRSWKRVLLSIMEKNLLHIKLWLRIQEWKYFSVILTLHGSVAQTKIPTACFVNSFRKELHSPTFLMMIYNTLSISSTIAPANVLISWRHLRCFKNFFSDCVALDLTIYLWKIGKEMIRTDKIFRYLCRYRRISLRTWKSGRLWVRRILRDRSTARNTNSISASRNTSG